MDDIELVIKIPKHYYENNIKKELPIYLTEEQVVAILPEEHGRLIDADKVISDGTNKGFCDWYDEIQYADTILEANKGDEINEETKEEQEWWEM